MTYIRLAFLTFVFISSYSREAYTQKLILKKDFGKKKIDKVSIDRNNQIYISDFQGNIEQISETGEIRNIFSPSLPASIELLESWQGLRTFIFYKNFQEYLILDRFLTPGNREKIDPSLIGFVGLATIANDNHIWLIDDADFSLKKYNPITRSLSIDVPLNSVFENPKYEFTFLKEYQNYLFLTEAERGVFIFDNLGNFINKIPAQGLNYISFHNNNMYYIEEGNVIEEDFYISKKTRLSLPNKAYKYVLFSGKNTFLFTENELFIYEQ